MGGVQGGSEWMRDAFGDGILPGVPRGAKHPKSYPENVLRWTGIKHLSPGYQPGSIGCTFGRAEGPTQQRAVVTFAPS